MGKFVIKDAVVLINGVNLSDHCSQASVNISVDDVEVTSMGDLSHTRIPGLRNDSFEVSFFADFAAGSVDATIYPLITAASVFPVSVKPTSAGTSATNPIYSGNCVLTGDYTPFSGNVGDASTATVTFPVASGTIHRATA